MKPDLKITGSIFTSQPVLKHAGGTSVPKVGERIEIRDDGSQQCQMRNGMSVE